MNPVAEDVLWPLQVAFLARMEGDATLVGLLGPQAGSRPLSGLYDGAAPEGALYPYITIGEAIETPRNTHGAYGAEVIQTLHVWIKKRGFKDGLEIAKELKRLFNHQPLTVAGHRVISIRHEQTLTLRDPNPEVRHLPVRFRVTTEQE